MFQKAKIIVDEAGTKETAVTVVEGDGCAIADEDMKFIVEEPFLFGIRDVETGMSLCMGDTENMGGMTLTFLCRFDIVQVFRINLK